MKKLFYVVFVAISAICVFTGCSNDEEEQVTKSQEEQFELNLQALRDKQESIISPCTRTDGELSDEELMQIAMVLDSLNNEFYYSNANYLSQYMPTTTLNDDEFSMISIDEDLLLSFVKQNFTSAFYTKVESFLHHDTTRAVQSTVSNATSMTPFEQVLASNLEVASEFGEEITMETDNLTSAEQKSKCEEQYDLQCSACESSIFSNLYYNAGQILEYGADGAELGGSIGGIIGAVLGSEGGMAGSAAGATVGGAIVGGAGGIGGGMYGAGRAVYDTYQQYKKCIDQAKKTYSSCLANERKK